MKLTPEDEAWLKDYCQVLAQRFPGLVEQVILYGSKARGTATPDPDLDLLVVIREGDRCLRDSVSTPGHMLALTTDVVPSIVVLTADEWESQRKRGAPSGRRSHGMVDGLPPGKGSRRKGMAIG